MAVVASEAMQSYDVKVTVFSDNKVTFKVYQKSIVKRKDGFEPSPLSDFLPLDNESIDDLLPKIKLSEKEEAAFKSIRTDNLARSRNLLIDLAHQNYSLWKSFITLTFKENVTDINEANKAFHIWVTCISQKFPNFKYIAVPEYQKRGAVHYHLITNIECGSDLIPQRKKKYTKSAKGGYKCLDYYNLPYWGKGFSSAFNLQMTDDKFQVAIYITKYLYKDIDNRLYGRKKIMHSQDLERPEYYQTKLKNLSYFLRNSHLVNSYSFDAQKPFQIGYQMFEYEMDEYEISLLKKNIEQEFEL